MLFRSDNNFINYILSKENSLFFQDVFLKNHSIIPLFTQFLEIIFTFYPFMSENFINILPSIKFSIEKSFNKPNKDLIAEQFKIQRSNFLKNFPLNFDELDDEDDEITENSYICAFCKKVINIEKENFGILSYLHSNLHSFRFMHNLNNEYSHNNLTFCSHFAHPQCYNDATDDTNHVECPLCRESSDILFPIFLTNIRKDQEIFLNDFFRTLENRIGPILVFSSYFYGLEMVSRIYPNNYLTESKKIVGKSIIYMIIHNKYPENQINFGIEHFISKIEDIKTLETFINSIRIYFPKNISFSILRRLSIAINIFHNKEIIDINNILSHFNNKHNVLCNTEPIYFFHNLPLKFSNFYLTQNGYNFKFNIPPNCDIIKCLICGEIGFHSCTNKKFLSFVHRHNKECRSTPQLYIILSGKDTSSIVYFKSINFSKRYYWGTLYTTQNNDIDYGLKLKTELFLNEKKFKKFQREYYDGSFLQKAESDSNLMFFNDFTFHIF